MRFSEIDLSLLDDIEARCGEVLRACQETGLLLYRGMSMGKSAFHGTIRTDRKPSDTAPDVHRVIDSWMADHGFLARRSNSLFVTTNRTAAGYYGERYIIFPLDGGDTTWFAGTDDLYTFLKTRVYRGKAQILWDRGDGFWKKVDGLMKLIKPTNGDLVAAMKSGHEIMFANTTYLAFHADTWEDAIKERFLAAT